MSVAVLISGSIFREPQQRVSQSGKSYVVATIRAAAADNSGSDFWSIMCFSASAGAELMRLGLNEKLAVQGSLKFEIYNGKISRSVFVDAILPLRAPPRERKPKAPPSGSKAADAIVKRSIDTPSDLNDDLDDLPF
jgi:hypothetical protein